MNSFSIMLNSCGCFDIFHADRGFIRSAKTREEALRFIDDAQEHQGYVASVSGGNGAAIGGFYE